MNMYATCATTGCVNAYTPIEVPGGVDSVACGPCGNPITNIADIKPEEGRVLPEWILQMLQTENSYN